ncbi:MAG: DUF1549 domain-containing protein [Planctomycetes bacterium]|nr:DUF1549 domain-containing protein [Planctomycetota bacterium]
MSSRRWFTCLTLGSVVATSSLLAQSNPLDVPKDHAVKMAKGLEVFKKHVKPVLMQKCLKCHGGKEVESEFSLADRDSLLKGGAKGKAVVPGKARDSLLYQVIIHAREPHMPHRASKLPAAAIDRIAEWIDLGAPYDNPLTASRIKVPSWTEKVLPVESKGFWSFQPLKKQAPPPVRDDSWCRTPLDRFILAKLEAAKLRPNESAEKRQLLRRAYFDLVGLPPPADEVEKFLADSSSDAWPRLIDRLLGNPHFGERWGRHWLDLVRFAESHGFEHDYDRPSAYHYRDFVIEALNRDMPFDQFVRWQIAGDEYAPNDNLALKATGFLAAGVHSTQITKNEVAKHRYDEMDDMLATIGTSMLGLTIGCARCHDHKFDPIPQRDYYRLLATFTTTVRSEINMNVDPAGYSKAKAEFDRLHEPFTQALSNYERDELPSRLARWESQLGEAQNRTARLAEKFPWIILEPSKAVSKEGAIFKKLEDGSLLATGKNGKFDVYTFTASTSATGISAVRLEALADASLVKGGPGRASNGNFALSDFKLSAKASGGRKPPDETPIKLRNPRATFEQKGLPIAAAIDTDARSSWAVDPQFGKNHAASFETETLIGDAGGTTLTFALSFNNNDGHNIGRTRLAVSTAGNKVALDAPGLPARIFAILSMPSEKRTREQTAALLTWYRLLDPEWQKFEQARQEHLKKAPQPKLAKVLISTEGLPAVRLHTQGDDFLPETHFLRRGDPDMKEGVASQGFLQVLLPSADAGKRWQSSPPTDWRTSYKRRALADWLTDVDHGAGKLLARVIVNRLWQHYLGRGLVATPSDFGNRGERPSHPQLLDWLASELIATGWKLKHIHKLILTSAVYQQSSRHDEARAKIDRDNKLCWRVPPRRLQAEVIRDSLLSVSGLLDPTPFGPGTLDEASKRRSIYFTVKRSKLIPMMTIFDAPEALSSIAERPTTTIAPQALYMMNNPQVRAYAQGFARRLVPVAKTSLDDAVRAGYKMALARPPTAEEAADSVNFIRQQETSYAGPARQEQALADFCQVLMCLNEFVYVE